MNDGAFPLRAGSHAVGIPRRDQEVYRDTETAGTVLVEDWGESFLASAGDRRSVQRARKTREEDAMKKPLPTNIHRRIDALLPFSGTVAEWAAKLGHADEAFVGRALQHFSTSHTTDRGKRVLTHVKTETHGVWMLRRHNLGYAEAFSTHYK